MGGCSLDNPGVEPPSEEINFPIAAVLTPAPAGEAPRFLYIANSNFDLRYNAGSIQSIDLEAVEGALTEACTRATPCKLHDVQSFVTDEVFVGAHASGLDVSPSGDTLYVSVRSDPSLTFIRVDAATGALECGGARCTDAFRRGEGITSERGVGLPADPVGVVAGSLVEVVPDATEGQDFILMGHRTGRVSFFVEEPDGPRLLHVVSDLPEDLVNIQLDPHGTAWLPSSLQAQVARVGIAFDPTDPARSFAFDAGRLNVTRVDVSGRGDTRDIAFDPRPWVERAYVLSRRPEALLIADRADAPPGELGVVNAIPIGTGPSRLDVAEVNVGTDTRVLVFASCFNSRDIWVIDPDHGQVVNVIRGLSGPFELEIDVARGLIYIVDFRASVIRIARLAPLFECMGGSAGNSCEPEVIGWIGEERPVGELL